jgi:GTPase SAR1 family protein
MGCIVSSPSVQPALNEVDAFLADAQQQEKYVYKILLLGAGESGKSTVVKQIKMLYKVGGGPSNREIMEYVLNIRRNVIEAIQILIEASKTLKVDLDDTSLQETSDYIAGLDTSVEVTPEIGAKVNALWHDAGIQKVFSRRNEYWNMDALPYYLNEVTRLSAEEYEPTEEDMVMTRVRTTGIVVTEVSEPPYTYDVVDVGGQRSERRKWIHCFDDVKAIIFLEGLAGYNQGNTSHIIFACHSLTLCLS